MVQLAAPQQQDEQYNALCFLLLPFLVNSCPDECLLSPKALGAAAAGFPACIDRMHARPETILICRVKASALQYAP
jgi:hypothetical protein